MKSRYVSLFVGLTLLVLAALAGCGPVAEPTPQVVEKPVTVVVPQTVEVTVVVEKIITATPRPSPTPTETPVPTPTIAVDIPDGWVLYEAPTDMFTLYRPSRWTVEEQRENGFSISLPGGGFMILGLVSDPLKGQVGDEAAINEMVSDVLDRNDRVLILSKGAWQSPVGANYVEYLSGDASGMTQARNHCIYAEKPVGPHTWWYIAMLSPLGDKLSEGDIEALQIMLATIQLNLDWGT